MSILDNAIVDADTYIWDKITEYLPPYRPTGTGFLSFNCPMCSDYKPRCGLKGGGSIGVNCYNCGFATRYYFGKRFPKKLRDFMVAIGIPDDDISRIKHKALAVARLLESVPDTNSSMVFYEPSFPEVPLPDGSKNINELLVQGESSQEFIDAVLYADSRGEELMKVANFQWSPAMPTRLIIPFYFEDKIVGYAARDITGQSTSRYILESPSNYLFNNHVMNNDNPYLFIVEGNTDALVIDGISPMGSKLNEKQIRWIKNSGKIPVVIPDRDEAGVKLIDIAQKNNWYVAFPVIGNHYGDWWEDDINDCDEAVRKYGKLYVLRSIIETMTNNTVEINIKKKKFIMGAE